MYIKKYKTNKLKAIRQIPTGIESAFQPTTFIKFGYPTEIYSLKELQRFVDHNSEIETPLLYQSNAEFKESGYINKFSHQEKLMSDALREKISQENKKIFGRPIKPLTSLIIQFAPFRIIQSIAKFFSINNIKVFEIGPGLGYLGALCSFQKLITYYSFDITTSLYLWQNYLFKTFSNCNEFVDLAFTPNKSTKNKKVS